MLSLAQRESGIAYSAQQEQAIRQAADTGILLLTGGPGTGKTTILKAVLSVYQQMGLKCVLAAPTGRAAKRLTEVTGEEASTIHRLLEATIDVHSGQMFFAKNEGDPLKVDAVIVDEMSMVDVQLLHDLLRAIPPRRRLILVGDPDQLPPVGPGYPFSDMLRSDTLPIVRLQTIFRQAQESLIVMNAHRVNRGELPELRNVKSDFFFLRCGSDEAAAQMVQDLCSTRLPKNMGIPAEQIQVLSPTRKGGVGTASLNARLQQALNPAVPGKKERQWGDFSFREGDRVMQIRNNYDIIWKKVDGSAVGSGMFNGDIGQITQIDHSMETVSVLFDDRIVDYDFSQLGELEPAYAMTVHKSQGSEYRAVVLCAMGGNPYLLSRSVLYTAITRARELLIIVGREDVVEAMTANAKKNRRYSGLKLRLQGKTL
jgi:exodeoxyribonuclease V alpha subunit